MRERTAGVFNAVGASVTEPLVDLKTLNAKIGQLAPENDFFVPRTRQGGLAACREIIGGASPLSGIPAGQAGRHQLIQWYYAPSPFSAADLALLRWIDELYVKHPLAGARVDVPAQARGIVAAQIRRR